MPSPSPTPKHCSSCGAKIHWAISTTTKKPMPVDEAPVENGNIQLWLRRGQVVAEMLTREAAEAKTRADLEAGVGPCLRLSHFATCENAKHHRKAPRV